MENYNIKELAEFINAVNKNADAAIKVSVRNGGGVVGAINGATLSVEITPPARGGYCGRATKCKQRKEK